ncbi:MAG: YibE/F family protein [Micropruina sp.]
MGHSHVPTHADQPQANVTARARAVLIGLLVVVGLVTVIGLILLRPDQAKLDALTDPFGNAPGVTFPNARILSVEPSCEGEVPEEPGDVPSNTDCATATVTVLDGPEAGQEVTVQLLGSVGRSGLRAGDQVQLIRIPGQAGEPVSLEYFGTNRLPTLGLLMALFVLVVLVIARLRGLLALVGLGFSGWVMFGFMLPALMSGRPGLPVALIGSTAIMFVVLYATHGLSLRTSAAFAGTLVGVLVTALLGEVAVEAARLGGMHDESSVALASLVPGLNFRDLIIAALTVAGLGVLNDVTITQASAVWELRGAAPTLSRGRIFASGMRIGRDHIASTIYTIVFAYTGAALTLLMLLHFYDRPILDLLATEEFATEIVRTLASAIGLVLSVPITTGIAALTLSPREVEPALVDPAVVEPAVEA